MVLVDDRYELLDVVASGGMASVWRARDTRLERVVALKRPHPAPAGDQSHVRMEREARVAASLTHPGLVTVYDFGRDEHGPYLVMEMVEGPTLQQALEDVPPSRGMEIGAQLADALATIHAAGIVHRDVKPANIIMSDRGPLLTDFGLALSPDATAKLTEPGKVVGTPSYVAPEVLRGEMPTAAADVYSLAKVIDELVSDGEPEARYVLSDALAASPADRPSAAAFAARLRGAMPTLATSVVGGSTMVLDVVPSPPVSAAPEPEGKPGWGVLRSALALGLLAIVAVLVGVALADDEPGADTSTPAAAAPDTTMASPSSTAAPSTTEAEEAETTTAPQPETVEELRAELESILLATPRSDMSPREVDDVIKKVDEAIAAADKGKGEEAGRKLGEVDRRLEEKLDDEDLSRAAQVVEELADRLGVVIERRENDDDD